MMQTRNVRRSAIAMVLGLLFPLSVEADEQAVASATFTLEPIVVIGTRTEKTQMDSPQSVEVVTARDIEAGMSQHVAEVINDIPGVKMDGGPRTIGEDINIRGLDGPRVQIRQDGARMDFLSGHLGRFFVNVDDIQQIEVLKGVGSALYGSDAMGGVINVRTKDPEDLLKAGKKTGARLRFNYDSVNRAYREYVSAFGVPNRKYGYLVSLGRWDTAKSIALSDGTRLGDSGQHGEQGMVKVYRNVTDSARVAFSYNKYFEEARVPGKPPFQVAADNFLRDRITQRDLIKCQITNRTDEGLLQDLDANIHYHLTSVRMDKLTGSRQIDDTDLGTVGVEVKNTNTLRLDDLVNQLTYGVEYYKDTEHGNQVLASGGGNVGSFPNGSFVGQAVYIQDDLELWERLNIIPAVRLDGFRSVSAGNDTNEDQRLSPKIGVVYKLFGPLHLFTNYGLGFRAPRLAELYQNGTHFPGNTFVVNPDLTPEKSKSFEAGARGQWGRLKYSSAYYLVTARDFINTVVSPTTTRAVNVSDVRIWGVESRLDYEIGMGLAAFVSTDQRTGKDQQTGRMLTTIAPSEMRVGLRYENTCRTFTGSWTGRLVDRQEAPEDQLDRTTVGGYGLWDLKTAVAVPGGFKGLRFNFGVENVFNKSYRDYLSNIPGPARNYVFGISQEFQW